MPPKPKKPPVSTFGTGRFKSKQAKAAQCGSATKSKAQVGRPGTKCTSVSRDGGVRKRVRASVIKSQPGYALYGTESEEQIGEVDRGLTKCATIVRQMLEVRKGRKQNLPETKIKSNRPVRPPAVTRETIVNVDALKTSPRQTNRQPLVIPTAHVDGNWQADSTSSGTASGTIPERKLPLFNKRLATSTPDPDKMETSIVGPENVPGFFRKKPLVDNSEVKTQSGTAQGHLLQQILDEDQRYNSVKVQQVTHPHSDLSGVGRSQQGAVLQPTLFQENNREQEERTVDHHWQVQNMNQMPSQLVETLQPSSFSKMKEKTFSVKDDSLRTSGQQKYGTAASLDVYRQHPLDESEYQELPSPESLFQSYKGLKPQNVQIPRLPSNEGLNDLEYRRSEGFIPVISEGNERSTIDSLHSSGKNITYTRFEHPVRDSPTALTVNDKTQSLLSNNRNSELIGRSGNTPVDSQVHRQQVLSSNNSPGISPQSRNSRTSNISKPPHQVPENRPQVLVEQQMNSVQALNPCSDVSPGQSHSGLSVSPGQTRTAALVNQSPREGMQPNLTSETAPRQNQYVSTHPQSSLNMDLRGSTAPSYIQQVVHDDGCFVGQASSFCTAPSASGGNATKVHSSPFTGTQQPSHPAFPPQWQQTEAGVDIRAEIDRAMQPLLAENQHLRSNLRSVSEQLKDLSREWTIQQHVVKERESATQKIQHKEMELANQLSNKVEALDSSFSSWNQNRVKTLEDTLVEERRRGDNLQSELRQRQAELEQYKTDRLKLLQALMERDGEKLRLRQSHQQEIGRLRTEVQLQQTEVDGCRQKLEASEKESHILGITLKQRDTEIDRLQELVRTMKTSMSELIRTQSPEKGRLSGSFNLQRLERLLREGNPHSAAADVIVDDKAENFGDFVVDSQSDIPQLTIDALAEHNERRFFNGQQTNKNGADLCEDLEKVNLFGGETEGFDQTVTTTTDHDTSSISTIKENDGPSVDVSLKDSDTPKERKKTVHFELNLLNDGDKGQLSWKPGDDSCSESVVSDEPSRYSVTDYFRKYPNGTTTVGNLINPSSAAEITSDGASAFSSSKVQGHSSPMKSPLPETPSRRYSPQNKNIVTSKPPLNPSGSQSQPPLRNPLQFDRDDAASATSGVTFSSVSTLATVDESVFREGLANLDANIARLQESLLQKKALLSA